MNNIPTFVWWILAISAVAVLATVLGYTKGQSETQNKWDAAIARGQAEIARLEAEAKAVTTIAEVRTEYKDRVVYEKGEDIIKTVEVFVPTAGQCELGGGFRVFHDASADNRIPDPSQIPNAAPTPTTIAAETISRNYTSCHRNAARLESWQQWAIEQCTLSDGCDADQLREWASGVGNE